MIARVYIHTEYPLVLRHLPQSPQGSLQSPQAGLPGIQSPQTGLQSQAGLQSPPCLLLGSLRPQRRQTPERRLARSWQQEHPGYQKPCTI